MSRTFLKTICASAAAAVLAVGLCDVGKFQSHYPKWRLTKDIWTILSEIYEHNLQRLREPVQ